LIDIRLLRSSNQSVTVDLLYMAGREVVADAGAP